MVRPFTASLCVVVVGCLRLSVLMLQCSTQALVHSFGQHPFQRVETGGEKYQKSQRVEQNKEG